MGEHTTDVTDMYAVHDALRHEFAKLPIMVKAVEVGNGDRTAVVGRHILLMTAFLHAHHSSEDDLLWPVLRERSPDAAEVVELLEHQHEDMVELLNRAEVQTSAWMEVPGIQERSSLHTTLIALERKILHHLASEEQQAVPLMQRDLTQEEYDRLGEHSRGLMTQEQLTIALGLILDDTSANRAEAVLAGMPPEGRAGFEQFGRPAYAEYKARLAEY